MVPIAVVVLIIAFIVTGSDEIPVAERRPPPANGLTNDVGDFRSGESEPVPSNACPALHPVLIGGSELDRGLLAEGLRTLCSVDLPDVGSRALSQFAGAEGIVRFAQFEATGVDSTAVQGPPITIENDGGFEPVEVVLPVPTILVNAKYARTDAKWIAPVVAHDAVMLHLDATTAETALLARQVEDAVCDQIVGDGDPSRGCIDAATLLALDDPLAALRDAGYR